MAKLTIRRGTYVLHVTRTALDSQREWSELGRLALRLESGEATAGEVEALAPLVARKMRALGIGDIGNGL